MKECLNCKSGSIFRFNDYHYNFEDDQYFRQKADDRWYQPKNDDTEEINLSEEDLRKANYYYCLKCDQEWYADETGDIQRLKGLHSQTR